MKLYIICLICLISNLSYGNSNKLIPKNSYPDNSEYYEKYISYNKISPIPTPNKIKPKNSEQDNSVYYHKISPIPTPQKIENIKVIKTSKITMIIFIFFEICISIIMILVCIKCVTKKKIELEQERDIEQARTLPVFFKKVDNFQNENCYRRITSNDNFYNVA